LTPSADEGLDIAALRRQDEREFCRFVQAHEALVLGLGQSLGLAPADRDDLAAETFAAAYRMLPGFRGEAKLSTWVYRVAWRTAQKVRRRYPRRGGGELPDVPGPQEPVGGEAEAEESARAVWAAVARLDEEQAVVVELFYRRGLSVEEVGRVLEKPEGTVKTLLFRARERLKVLLGPMAKVM
jgi:RNA polymerase sigma-70 factor (ECF subfamily)